ncbi:hypothetical protein EB75_04730 [Mycobacterium sp. ST-F2]|uniref:PASTA domain-containing protein n=1 Tax=Mycobacterium sp. ST-F2 TaxID=1490484 RepID=UPI0009403F43|nr:PASTA domain-containing protein [Mycobacterium sp. ST-F2]OKH86043.1 hypothetical protein EB75_04730 [Mycobacterium sp. ST-F2]
MTAWQISPATERVELAGGQAEVVFTVTNPGPVDTRATVDIVGSEQAQASWFTVAEPQQVIPHGGSKQFTATVKPGEKAPAGTHWLSGRVYSADAAPEEDSVTSNRVTFEIKPPPEKPKSKDWLWALIAGGVLVLVIIVVMVTLMTRRSGVEVPDVVGKPQAQAEQMLKDNGLVPKAAQQPSDAVANGNVISQDPTAGASAKKDSTVTIAVSSGADLVQIPDVVGMDVNDAVDRVQKAGLVPGFAQGASSVPANHVYRTDPDHVPVPKGSKVILYVSKGPSGTNDACKGIHPPKWCLVRITDILVPTLMPSFTVPVGPGH